MLFSDSLARHNSFLSIVPKNVWTYLCFKMPTGPNLPIAPRLNVPTGHPLGAYSLAVVHSGHGHRSAALLLTIRAVTRTHRLPHIRPYLKLGDHFAIEHRNVPGLTAGYNTGIDHYLLIHPVRPGIA